jgi:PAS domain S-box-containing protein
MLPTNIEMQEKRNMPVDFSNLADKIGDMIIILNEGHEIIYGNAVLRKVLGYTSLELTNLNCRNIVRSDCFQVFHELISNKYEGLHELWVIGRNGDEFPVELNMKWTEWDGLNYLIATFRDISERKQVENVLRLREEYYRDVVENQGEGIGIVDLNETFIFANPAADQIFGVEPGGLINRNLKEFVDPLHIEQVNHQTEKRSKGERSTYEILILNAKQETIHLLVTATPRFDNEGNHTGTFGIFRNITARKEIENKLLLAKEKVEELDKLKSSLLLNISHELRTPMNGILGFSTLLRDELKDEELKNMADIILKSGTRLMTTLNSIMELAQVESEKTLIHLEDTDIGKLTSKIIESNNVLFETTDVEFTENITEGLIARIDKNLFTNIIFHLVDNAIKFTKKGSISINVNKEEVGDTSFVVIQIKDTGIGISGKQLTYIFDAFRQGNEGVGRKYEGFGLGLSLCKKFITIMGGEITVESVIGTGSVFTVRFKIPNETTISAIGIDSVGFTETRNPDYKPSILIVEDNKFNADLISIYLGGKFNTAIAYSGPEALSMAESKIFDLILMDINLGHEMDGIITVRELRKHEKYQMVPIIAITGYSSFEEKKYILDQGLSNFLSKPFDKQSLLRVVQKALQDFPDKMENKS